MLNRASHTIDNLRIIAICPSTNYLVKVPLMPSGEIGTPTTVNVGGRSNCLEQAAAINARN